MNFEEAWDRVLLAGRELGSGPAVAVPRLVPDYEEAEAKLRNVFAWANRRPTWMTEEQSRPTVSGENWIKDNVGRVLLGVAVGLVMAEDEDTMRALREISAEWLADH